jgi:hypothetical protein
VASAARWCFRRRRFEAYVMRRAMLKVSGYSINDMKFCAEFFK